MYRFSHAISIFNGNVCVCLCITVRRVQGAYVMWVKWSLPNAFFHLGHKSVILWKIWVRQIICSTAAGIIRLASSHIANREKKTLQNIASLFLRFKTTPPLANKSKNRNKCKQKIYMKLWYGTPTPYHEQIYGNITEREDSYNLWVCGTNFPASSSHKYLIRFLGIGSGARQKKINREQQ